MSVIETVTGRRLIPVVVLDDVADALPLADALVAGGLPIAEVTFRTPAATGALAVMAARGDILVGAGTVLTTEQVDAAVDAGARFVVSPGVGESVVERCRELGVPHIPGVATATEVQTALGLGLTTLKFFPAAAAGAVPAVKALSAAFGDVSFVPTGGIALDDVRDYLAVPSVSAVGGSWMVADRLIASGMYDEIARLVTEAVAEVDR